MRLISAFAILSLAAPVLGCGGGTGSPPPDAATDADTSLPVVAVVRAVLNRDLDLLFVVDNSGSMAEEQQALTVNFPLLINTLNALPGGLPNLHLGVVSTNVGTGGVNIGGCSSASRPQGDDGNLLTNACAGLTGSFVSDLKNPDGSRTTNYTGDLTQLFTCMARLGTTGCGFEQPLEAMFRALQNGRNPGFLRPSALLAIVILSDEDDCSAQAGGALFGDPNATITSALGPRTSFRCYEFGVACADDPNPRSFGTRTGCAPRVGSPFMKVVQPYVDFVRSLKADPSAVVVSAIIGTVDAAHTAVVGPDVDDATRPALAPSCMSGAGVAAPGFRLRAFVEGFPEHNAIDTICNQDLSGALQVIGDQVTTAAGSPCIAVPLADTRPDLAGLQPRCEAEQFTVVNGVRTDVVGVPSCDVGTTPCWRLTADPASCPAAPGNLTVEIDRGATPAPAGSSIELRCAIEA